MATLGKGWDLRHHTKCFRASGTVFDTGLSMQLDIHLWSLNGFSPKAIRASGTFTRHSRFDPTPPSRIYLRITADATPISRLPTLIRTRERKARLAKLDFCPCTASGLRCVLIVWWPRIPVCRLPETAGVILNFLLTIGSTRQLCV